MSLEDEVHELVELLETEDLVPFAAMTAFERFGEAARNEVVARTARQFSPPPSGRLLAQLPQIVTDVSRPALTGIYLANLRSPDPLARLSSLTGLVALEYPQATDLALAALRDGTDQVVAAAARILLPAAEHDERLRALLAGVHADHRGDPAFHLTTTLLAAHGIGPGEVA
ncbi:hypothetical protein [Frankia sp. CiP1_Cm_nod2]|uniref:hypothetical protein n=1 Tax=Frankia sp. CiP1_Cm_nod2 TaxID=2897161 RepID=UPI002023D341